MASVKLTMLGFRTMPPVFSTNLSRAARPFSAIRPLRLLLPVLVIFLVAMSACGPMIFFGASEGHSIVNNTLWLQHFSEELRQGEIYPRWLMNINHGEGSPAFYYYAPLPFYIISIPALISPTSSLSLDLAWGEILLLGLSGSSFFIYARRRFDPAASLVGGIVYMLLPYHFETDLWIRQDLGELTGYVWMPLILLFSDTLLAGSRTAAAGLAIVYCLMILSHLPSALLFSICLAGYVLVQIPLKRAGRTLLHFAGALSVGVLLSGEYLGPALFSQQYVHMDAIWVPRNDFHGWFFPPTAWAKAEGHYPFMNRLFIEALLTVFLFALTWLAALYHAIPRRIRIFSGSLMLLSVAAFLMSSASAIVWEYAPFLWKVQFPWRLSLVLDLSAAIGALHAAHRMFSGFHRGATLSLALLVSILIWCTATADLRSILTPYLQPGIAKELDSQIKGDLELPEYATRWTPGGFEKTADLTTQRAPLTLIGTSGSLTVTRWRPRYIAFEAQLSQPTRITVRQFYFPNWQATDDAGHSLPLSADPSTGLLIVQLPAGHNHVNLILRSLQTEQIGWLVTLLGAGLLLLLGLSDISKAIRAIRLKHSEASLS